MLSDMDIAVLQDTLNTRQTAKDFLKILNDDLEGLMKEVEVINQRIVSAEVKLFNANKVIDELYFKGWVK